MPIDLNDLIKKDEHKYDVKIAPAEDTPDADLRRMKERWRFAAALLIVIGFTIGLAAALLFYPLSAEAQKFVSDFWVPSLAQQLAS
jgi:hypothetical protein